jgi:hypothetical protein
MTTNLDVLAQKVKSLSVRPTHEKDSAKNYQPTVDGTGNGNALIRFLPALDGEEFPFVQIHTHAFQGQTGKWFIENCPGTCPVCESNRVLLNSGNEANKKLANARKRKMSYVANVLVVKDTKAPEKEGKVFLFKFGVRIMDKIKDMIAPPFTDSEPVDLFDTQEGANFRLRVVKTGSFPDYDKSAFDKQSPLGDEQAVEAALKQRHSLEAIVAPTQFKSYEELKAKFQQICGAEVGGASAA